MENDYHNLSKLKDGTEINLKELKALAPGIVEALIEGEHYEVLSAIQKHPLTIIKPKKTTPIK